MILSTKVADDKCNDSPSASNTLKLELSRLKSDLVLYYNFFHNMAHLPRVYCLLNYLWWYRLDTSFFSTNLDNDFFFTQCVACWNYLSAHVVQCSSVIYFKNSLFRVDLNYFCTCIILIFCTYFCLISVR